jgi:hypothetical protein
MEEVEIVLGETYKDSVTGFIGIATAKCVYLYSSASINLESQVDGKPVSQWFDIHRIKHAG